MWGKGETIEATVCDLKSVNPNSKGTEDWRTLQELIAIIGAKGSEVAALALLKG